MRSLYLPPPPQDRKPTEKLKSIFEDDKLLIEKSRAYLQLFQNWLNAAYRVAGKDFLFPIEIAEKLGISEDDATELIEFAHSPEYGEFERDYLLNTPHISIDSQGNEIQTQPDPFEGL
jgi:hypothetical protein